MNRAFAFLLIVGLAACGGGGDFGSSPSVPQGELIIVDIVVGDGPVAETGDSAAVHYVGRLANGTQFETSYDGGQPYSFVVGAGQVIPGWDLGVPGMRVGGQRRLTIPPHLAYGASGRGAIPPNATLIFDVELVELVGK